MTVHKHGESRVEAKDPKALASWQSKWSSARDRLNKIDN